MKSLGTLSKHVRPNETKYYSTQILVMLTGAVASWLVRLFADRAIRVRALARDTVLCSWAKHFILTVPLSTEEYK